MKTILIAKDHADARAYLDEHPYMRPAVIVTHRSPHAAHGWVGRVYSTPAAREHESFDALAFDTSFCAVTIPERDRVA